jgi:hypothetical protein
LPLVERDATFRGINRAIGMLDQKLESRVANVEALIPRQAPMLDELDRELDEIKDERVRRRLVKVITRQDDARRSILDELGEILTPDLFDELRTLSTDIKLSL